MVLTIMKYFFIVKPRKWLSVTSLKYVFKLRKALFGYLWRKSDSITLL